LKLGGRGTSNTSLSIHHLSPSTIGKLRKANPAVLPIHKPVTRSQTQAHNRSPFPDVT
jgi:hypothetical protein